jgi:hypothetical protein
MSTEWKKIKSVNPNFPSDFIEFSSGASGYKFFIGTEGSEEGRKIWFDRESWEELKAAVDSVLDHDEARK